MEEYLGRDDRAVLPLGCTEQHAYLSLSTDSILAERLAVEAAEPLGVPVFPVLAYGITPYFRAFPGTITLRVETYMSVVRDILDAMAEQGFKRILIVNGHGAIRPPKDSSANGWQIIPECGSSSTTGGTRPKPGRKCRQSIPWLPTRRGWKIFRGRAWRKSTYPQNRSR